jgi:hypothetical protein
VALAADGRGGLPLAFLAGDRDVAVASMQPGGALTPLAHLRSSGDARRTGPRLAAAGDQELVIWGSGDGYQAAMGSVP